MALSSKAATNLNSCVDTGRSSPVGEEPVSPLARQPKRSPSPFGELLALQSKQQELKPRPAREPPFMAVKKETSKRRRAPPPRLENPAGQVPSSFHVPLSPPGSRRRPPSPAIGESRESELNDSKDFSVGIPESSKHESSKQSSDALEKKEHVSSEPSRSECDTPGVLLGAEEMIFPSSIPATEAQDPCGEGLAQYQAIPDSQHPVIDVPTQMDGAMPDSVRNRLRLESVVSKVCQTRAKESTNRAYATPSPMQGSRPGVRPTPLAWLTEP